ncbi:aspartate/glutamate racemase family protein [Amycolatopsis sp. GM8]|uniref:aspartate/glutamate racemase family protein n=1 Tax=Amycolatopsis sp. GM8 TaxID=2896530 RepID=UPI001F002155|nr:amino acid racemase [Amycolatopsis sp. GM8]
MTERPLVGVLGGMGPLATADFYQKVIELTPATRDQDHVRLAIWADPTTPDRTTALLRGGPSPVSGLIRGLLSLEACGAQVIAIPCNTAHAYLAELRAASSTPILDMIDLAVARTRETNPAVTRIGVLATRGTHASGMYDRAAAARGIELVHLRDDQQSDYVDTAIAMVKSGRDFDVAESLIAKAARVLSDDGAEAVIAGCTEIPPAARGAARVLPVVDATKALAHRVVTWGLAQPNSTPCASGSSVE